MDPLRTKGTIVRSGLIDLSWSSLRSSGREGHSRSSTVAEYITPTSGSTTAYDFEFSFLDVNPSNGPYVRWLGFPVRCLV